jgi:hypothetical protein
MTSSSTGIKPHGGIHAPTPQRNSSSVVEERFAELDIESRSEILTLTARHPVYHTLRHELALTLSLEHLKSDTFLLGEPFDFSLGSKDGPTRDTALRVAQEWLDRAPNQVVAVRSRFSLALRLLEPRLTRMWTFRMGASLPG